MKFSTSQFYFDFFKFPSICEQILVSVWASPVKYIPKSKDFKQKSLPPLRLCVARHLIFYTLNFGGNFIQLPYDINHFLMVQKCWARVKYQSFFLCLNFGSYFGKFPPEIDHRFSKKLQQIPLNYRSSILMVHTFLLSLNTHYFSIRIPALLSYDFLDRTLFLLKNNNFNVSWVLDNLYCFLILCARNVCDMSTKVMAHRCLSSQTTHSLQQESIPIGCVPPVRATEATICQHQKGQGVRPRRVGGMVSIPRTESHTPVKTLPSRNFVGGW